MELRCEGAYIVKKLDLIIIFVKFHGCICPPNFYLASPLAVKVHGVCRDAAAATEEETGEGGGGDSP